MPPDRSRHVGAVTVAIGGRSARRDLVDAGGGAPAELIVGEVDAGVDDVRRDASALAAPRIGAIERERALVHAIEAPVGARLGAGSGDRLVLLHVGDVRLGAKRGDGRVGELEGEAVQCRLVGVAEPAMRRFVIACAAASTSVTEFLKTTMYRPAIFWLGIREKVMDAGASLPRSAGAVKLSEQPAIDTPRRARATRCFMESAIAGGWRAPTEQAGRRTRGAAVNTVSE